MELFAQMEKANREYMDSMKEYIALSQDIAGLQLKHKKVRDVMMRARDEMHALEQEAKEFKLHTEPLTELELAV